MNLLNECTDKEIDKLHNQYSSIFRTISIK